MMIKNTDRRTDDRKVGQMKGQNLPCSCSASIFLAYLSEFRSAIIKKKKRLGLGMFVFLLRSYISILIIILPKF